jgi:hypothetical protein
MTIKVVGHSELFSKGIAQYYINSRCIRYSYFMKLSIKSTINTTNPLFSLY